LKEVGIPDFSNHLVIIGKDPSALKLSIMAKYNKIRHISIIFDPAIAREKMNEGDHVVYGDAINEPILRKAHVDTADIVVISVGSFIPSMAILEKVRLLNKSTYILVRAAHIENVERLYKLGADQVLPEKLEIAIDLLNRILIKRQIPSNEISNILKTIRISNLGIFSEKDILNQPSIQNEFSDLKISALIVREYSEAEGKSPIGIDLRKKTGVTLLAIKRGEEMLEHPAPDTVFLKNDVAYVLGDPDQVSLASEMLVKKL
jgi:CPA2 family monovalent cation:H+ antiporter-2